MAFLWLLGPHSTSQHFQVGTRSYGQLPSSIGAGAQCLAPCFGLKTSLHPLAPVPSSPSPQTLLLSLPEADARTPSQCKAAHLWGITHTQSASGQQAWPSRVKPPQMPQPACGCAGVLPQSSPLHHLSSPMGPPLPTPLVPSQGVGSSSLQALSNMHLSHADGDAAAPPAQPLPADSTALR